ncbi:hypothetical protein CY35_10G097000 [Sphagnum magellanicum]|nr:hypothetical protein CY35_10G097000 [Sphagnum magellanicum]
MQLPSYVHIFASTPTANTQVAASMLFVDTRGFSPTFFNDRVGGRRSNEIVCSRSKRPQSRVSFSSSTVSAPRENGSSTRSCSCALHESGEVSVCEERSRFVETGESSWHERRSEHRRYIRPQSRRLAEKSSSQKKSKKTDRENDEKNDDEGDDTGASASSWSSIAGSRPPLTPEEEIAHALDIQDLLSLQEKRNELEKHIERIPTDQEWADSVGISLVKLYARVGKGRAAKRKMVAANLRLVESVARKFHGRGLSHWELCQEGAFGLLKSTEKFDGNRRTKFSSYAFFWIQERMAAAAKKFRHVLRIGRPVYQTASLILQQKDIQDVLRITTPVKSLDVVIASEATGDGKNHDCRQLSDASPAVHPWLFMRESELRKEVVVALNSLKSREQQVMQLRYGLDGKPPLSRHEVSDLLGVTTQTIRTDEKGALEKLRLLSAEDGFQQYLSDNFWSQ